MIVQMEDHHRHAHTVVTVRTLIARKLLCTKKHSQDDYRISDMRWECPHHQPGNEGRPCGCDHGASGPGPGGLPTTAVGLLQGDRLS